MVALLNPWRQAFAGYGKSVRLCSWGYCSISLSSRERSSAPLLKNTGFHHVFVSFFGEHVQRASSRDFSFRSRGIDMQIPFTFFTRCFYSPQHSTAFFPGNQIRLSINSRSSSLANLPPDMHPLASNLGYALHTMLLYLFKETLSTKSHRLHHKLPHFSPFPQSHKILTTTVLEIRCVFRIRLSPQTKTMQSMNHSSKNIEWEKNSEIVSKSLESWRQSPNTKQSFQRKPPVLWGEKRIHRQLSLTRSFAWSIYASVLFSSFGSRSHFQHQTVDNGFTQNQRRSLREAKSCSNRAQIETYSHQSVPNTFLHQMSWFSIAGRDTRAKKSAEKHKGVRHARRRSQVAIATNFFLLYEIVDGFTRSAVTSSLTAVTTHG